MQLNRITYTLKFLGSISLFLFCGFSANAQQIESGNKTVVLYDPLLWNHQLKLSISQREKIQQINLQFYERIYRAAREDAHNRTSLQHKAEEYVQQRSEQIWEAFNQNQRKKWMRLWNHYST